MVKITSTNAYAFTLSGLADGKTGTFSCWFYSPEGEDSVCTFGSATPRFLVTFTKSTDTLSVVARNAANTIILDADIPFTIADDTWYHVMCNWDLATASDFKAYVNGASVTPTLNTYTNDTIDYTDNAYSVLSTQDDTYVQDLIFILDDVDLTSANVRSFFVYGPKPEAPGAHPVGVQYLTEQLTASPVLALGSNWRDFHTNYGTGGNGLVTGTPSRPDVRGPGGDYLSAQGFQGETWGRCALCGFMYPQSQLKQDPERGTMLCTTRVHDYHDTPSRGRNRAWKGRYFY